MKKKSTLGQKIVSFLGCLWPFVAFLLIQNFMSMIIMMVPMMPLVFSQSLDDVEAMMYQIMNGMMGYLLFVCTIGTSIVGYCWYKYRYKETYEYPVRKVAKGKDYIYIIAMAFTAQFVSSILIAVVVFLFPESLQKYNELISSSGVGTSLLTFITAAFIAPIGEECFYRGIVQRKAEKFLPLVWANVLQAALFGIMHMNLIQGVYAFALGLLMGYVHQKYQALTMTILLHVAFNVFGQTMPVIFGGVPTVFENFITAASVVLLVLLIRAVSNVSVPAKEEREASFTE